MKTEWRKLTGWGKKKQKQNNQKPTLTHFCSKSEYSWVLWKKCPCVCFPGAGSDFVICVRYIHHITLYKKKKKIPWLLGESGLWNAPGSTSVMLHAKHRVSSTALSALYLRPLKFTASKPRMMCYKFKLLWTLCFISLKTRFILYRPEWPCWIVFPCKLFNV